MQEKMLELGLPLSPMLIAIGENFSSIHKYVVYIHQDVGADPIIYEFEKLFNALDVLFKTFFVLNIDYPKMAENLWLLIQKFVYNITKPGEKRSQHVLDVIQRLTKAEIKDKTTAATIG